MNNRIDLTGQKFGRLTVLARVWRVNTSAAYWLCRCDCGTLRVVYGTNLTKGLSKSCGCLQKEIVTECNSSHGLSRSRIYRIWSNIKTNCHNPNSPNYAYSGAKGIDVCDEWQIFDSFYEWAMENGYADDLVLGRINKNKGYSPDNCIWVTYKTDCNNRSYNNNIEFRGEVHTLKEWSEKLDIPRNTLWMRMNKYGWTIERTLTTKVRGGRRT